MNVFNAISLSFPPLAIVGTILIPVDTKRILGKSMTTVVVDEKGRIYIPSEIRRALGIKKGSKLKLYVEEGKIVLIVEKSTVKLVKRGSEWGREAFLDAGEALAFE